MTEQFAAQWRPSVCIQTVTSQSSDSIIFPLWMAVGHMNATIQAGMCNVYSCHTRLCMEIAYGIGDLEVGASINI